MAADNIASVKRCTKCGETKPTTEFGKNGDGLRAHCKPCRVRRQVEYQRENASTHNARLRRWRAEKPEKANAIWRLYYAKHQESRLETCRQWRVDNRELRRAICRAWKLENTHKSAEYKRRREAALLSAVPAWADFDAMRRIYAEAKRLTIETGIRHEVDHIVPIVSAVVCGLHVEANLRVIPGAANRSKGNRLINV